MLITYLRVAGAHALSRAEAPAEVATPEAVVEAPVAEAAVEDVAVADEAPAAEDKPTN